MRTSPRKLAQKKQDAAQAFLKYYSDKDRIQISRSATGEGFHLRWRYSEDDLVKSEEGEVKNGKQKASLRSPTPFSTGSVDEDGDSVMGDETSQSGSTSDATTERLETPQPQGAYDPGSVILTPKKEGRRRPLQREKRMGSFDWWHECDGVQTRVALVRAESVAPGMRPRAPPSDTSFIVPKGKQALEKLKAARARYGYTGSTDSGTQAGDEEEDSDDSDARSVATVATVIVDPYRDEEPTLPGGREIPTIRQPPLKPSKNAAFHRLGLPGARVYQDEKGQWVRDGSVGPDVAYDLKLFKLPPKKNADVAAGFRPNLTNIDDRTDTESVASGSREESGVPEPKWEKQRKMMPPPQSLPRRSGRIAGMLAKQK